MVFERKEFSFLHLTTLMVEKNRFYDLIYRFNENNYLSESKIYFFSNVNEVLKVLKPVFFGVKFFVEVKGLKLNDACLLFGWDMNSYYYQKRRSEKLDREAYNFVEKLFFNFFEVEYINFIKKM